MERLNGTLQENLITLLCWSDEHGRVIANTIDVNLFEGDYHVIAERAMAYWQKHKEAPKVHADDLVADIIADPHNRKAAAYKRILTAMIALSKGINTGYVMETLNTFTRGQKIKAAIVQSAEKIHANSEMVIEEVEGIWNTLLRTREVNFDPGVRLRDVARIIDYQKSASVEFITGIPEFDRSDVASARGQLMLMLAPTGKGKSWWLIHVGKCALHQRKKVIHISLEMDAEEIMSRYYQSFFAIPKRANDDVNITTLDVNSLEKLTGFGSEKVKPEFGLDSKSVLRELETRVDHFGTRFDNLIVKRFPMRSVTIANIEAYLDNLEVVEGFIPDVLILDYVGVLKTDAKNHRIDLGRQVEDLRGLLTRRHLAGFSAHQVSREGAKAAIVKSTHVSEDWTIIQTADKIVTYSQTDAEERYGLARLYVNKNRNDRAGWGVLVTQSYATGQFCLDSVMLHSQYWDALKDLTKDEKTGDDDDDGPNN